MRQKYIIHLAVLGCVLGVMVAVPLGCGSSDRSAEPDAIVERGKFPPPKHSEFPNDWYLESYRGELARLEGRRMPPLDASDWTNGTVTADDMRGKVLLIDFFTTWCGPCRVSMPHVNAIKDKYADRGVLVMGVVTGTKQESMEQVVKDWDIRFPVTRDPKLLAHNSWNVRFFPTYVVVDRHGVVRAIGLWRDHVEQVLDQVLAEGTGAQP